MCVAQGVEYSEEEEAAGKEDGVILKAVAAVSILQAYLEASEEARRSDSMCVCVCVRPQRRRAVRLYRVYIYKYIYTYIPIYIYEDIVCVCVYAISDMCVGVCV